MSDDSSSRKRVAEKQGSRDDCGRDDDEFVTTPQVASAEVLATRRIVSVRKPEGSVPPSPFGSVLGSFAPKLPTAAPPTTVAPSPFAAFGGGAPPPAAPSGGFGSGFNFGITPKPADAETPPAASAAPAPVGGFNFNFGVAPGGSTSAPKFDFGAAVSAFSAAAASAKQQAPTASPSAAAAADDADEDPEAEVPIVAAGGAPTLAAVEVKTGEEGDRVLFEAAAAKLFEFASGDDSDKKSWHERGAGAVKVSTKADGSSTRLVMRDAKLKKVLLNCAVAKNSFHLAQKQEKMFSFSAPVSESVVATYLVKITGPKAIEEMKGCIEALEKVLS